MGQDLETETSVQESGRQQFQVAESVWPGTEQQFQVLCLNDTRFQATQSKPFRESQQQVRVFTIILLR